MLVNSDKTKQRHVACTWHCTAKEAAQGALLGEVVSQAYRDTDGVSVWTGARHATSNVTFSAGFCSSRMPSI